MADGPKIYGMTPEDRAIPDVDYNVIGPIEVFPHELEGTGATGEVGPVVFLFPDREPVLVSKMMAIHQALSSHGDPLRIAEGLGELIEAAKAVDACPETYEWSARLRRALKAIGGE